MGGKETYRAIVFQAVFLTAMFFLTTTPVDSFGQAQSPSPPASQSAPAAAIAAAEVIAKPSDVANLLATIASKYAPSAEIEKIENSIPEIARQIDLDFTDTSVALGEQPPLTTVQAAPEASVVGDRRRRVAAETRAPPAPPRPGSRHPARVFRTEPAEARHGRAGPGRSGRRPGIHAPGALAHARHPQRGRPCLSFNQFIPGSTPNELREIRRDGCHGGLQNADVTVTGGVEWTTAPPFQRIG